VSETVHLPDGRAGEVLEVYNDEAGEEGDGQATLVVGLARAAVARNRASANERAGRVPLRSSTSSSRWAVTTRTVLIRCGRT
jgi:hypothetical protein